MNGIPKIFHFQLIWKLKYHGQDKIFFVEKWTMRNKKWWAIRAQDIPIEFIDLDILGVFVGCQFMF